MLIILTKLDTPSVNFFSCVSSPTEIKLSHTIFLSSNWTVNQNSEITCQSVNTLIQVVDVQTLSLSISLAASKIVVSQNWKKLY